MAFYRERGLREFTQEVTGDGIGIGGGLIVGGTLGRYVEDLLVKDPSTPSGMVDNTSTLTKKLSAWIANNGTKAALYIASKRYGVTHPIARKATEALAGSVVYDTMLRLANHGYNPANVQLAGYRILGGNTPNPATVQKLVQENSILRTELNKALQKLAGAPTIAPTGHGNVSPMFNPDTPADFRYAAVPDPYERQRRYGAMPVVSAPTPIVSAPTSPAVAERERKFGAMPFEQPGEKTNRQRQWGFASGPSDTSNVFGML